MRSGISALLLLSDPFGKTDEKEPLTNAVRSDSAIIGGKPFYISESRKDTSDFVLWKNLSESFLDYGHATCRLLHDLQDCEPFHE